MLTLGTIILGKLSGLVGKNPVVALELGRLLIRELQPAA